MKELIEYRTSLIDRLVGAAGEFRAECLAVREPFTPPHAVEKAVIETVEDGIMTKDLMLIAKPKVTKYALTEEFIDAVAERLKRTFA